MCRNARRSGWLSKTLLKREGPANKGCKNPGIKNLPETLFAYGRNASGERKRAFPDASDGNHPFAKPDARIE